MASRMLGSSLGGRAARRCSPAGSHASAATSALTQMYYHAAFPSTVNNNGVTAPATGSEEEDWPRTAPLGEEDPVDRVAEKAAEVARKAKGVVEKVKEAERVANEQAKEIGQDVKESIKKTRP